jgi:hypothetical protein
MDITMDMMGVMAFAERRVDAAACAALPTAAQYAWDWCAFDEPVVEALRDLPNAKIVIYEDLCRQPEVVARDLSLFAGLDWHSQTTGFLTTSTHHDRPAGYFDVFRSSGLVADHWRQTMSLADQDAVRTVLSTSSLICCWSDPALSAA